MPVIERLAESDHEWLKNSSPDQILMMAGPALPVEVAAGPDFVYACKILGVPPPKPIRGMALIDTGCDFTSIDEQLCLNLGLHPCDRQEIAHAGGLEFRHCYPILIRFPDTSLPLIDLPRAISVNLSDSGEHLVALLGRDFLAGIRMTYNGPKGRLEIAF